MQAVYLMSINILIKIILLGYIYILVKIYLHHII